MTDAINWQRGALKDVHTFAHVNGRRVDIARSEKRVGSRRRDGWHLNWYFRIDGGPWVGDSSRPTSHAASIAADKHLGFTTMVRARAAGIGAAK